MNPETLLQNRRSTRRFDPSAEISRAELDALLAQAGRAPSGNNSQPWRIMVLTDPALRQSLLPEAYGQEQVVTASAVLVLLGDREAYREPNLRRIHEEEFAEGCFDADVRDFLIQAAVGFYRPFDETDTQRSLALDCGLWAMSFMLAAENAGWQTVPMTGYKRDGLRRVLNLPERYLDMILIALGKGAERGHRTLRQNAAAVSAWNALP
ncbi:nitroreductase family protein [Neisseria sp. oral taxon 020 str. F0370]|uniref:nitroreductase family protein n=1 Tax=unclassified Neisseria TaxID=2623750 RepID=UPI0002A37CF7|nr:MULTISPECIES: nitroreductase family protein [unclassified Neisseria]ASP17230.1 nitroreductase family protein [Neisseria sp. KEM232]EKY08514.1 nitroreductase family protein [Neisseria sp. oral taxon 020 str. F0370]